MIDFNDRSLIKSTIFLDISISTSTLHLDNELYNNGTLKNKMILIMTLQNTHTIKQHTFNTTFSTKDESIIAIIGEEDGCAMVKFPPSSARFAQWSTSTEPHAP